MRQLPFPATDNDLSGPAWERFRQDAPMTRAFNHLIAGPHFARRFGR